MDHVYVKIVFKLYSIYIMRLFNKIIYSTLNATRNNTSLNIINKIANIDDYNLIIPNLYLGNIKNANNIDFLKENDIQAIVNCTENEEFNEYFIDKSKYRLSINDSKNENNINKFKNDIFDVIYFIEENLNNNKKVYVHCYWGLMRSATVIAGYLIYKYKLSIKDSINIIQEQRPKALVSFYNFNEVLEYVHNKN